MPTASHTYFPFTLPCSDSHYFAAKSKPFFYNRNFENGKRFVVVFLLKGESSIQLDDAHFDMRVDSSDTPASPTEFGLLAGEVNISNPSICV